MYKQFEKPLPQSVLNLEKKTRTNTFSWRGQFSPEFANNLLKTYCPKSSVVLDPFCGSGTVLCEAGYQGIEAIGVELNPAAYILSKTYQLINNSSIENNSLINSFLAKVQDILPHSDMSQFEPDLSQAEFEHFISKLTAICSVKERFLLETFVILFDLHKNDVTFSNIWSALNKTIKIVRYLPHSKQHISVILGDARRIPLVNESIDFVLTSPPYINVFNYHQNYRRSAELLGWNLLKISRSEIGSNRANRGNRFITVIQYCIDIGTALTELHRVLKNQGRMIFVVGNESKVLGVPFNNADIIEKIATSSGLFELKLKQSRLFKNKFGINIREDLLHIEKNNHCFSTINTEIFARTIALNVLQKGLSLVFSKNKDALLQALDVVNDIKGTSYFDSEYIHHYNHHFEQKAVRG